MMGKHRLIIISVSGIGNTILQSPLINALLNQQQFTIDVLFKDRTVQSVFQSDDRINEQFVLPKGLINTCLFLLNLRNNQYEYSLVCFPSNQFWFHLLTFLIGAKKRVIHAYKIATVRTLSFLSNVKIPSSDELHDVDQNLNLLKAFNLSPEKANKTLLFSTLPRNDQYADDFIKNNNLINKTLIGLHPGSKYSERYRRWPQSNFVHLMNSLNADGMECLLFAGPDEIEMTQDIYSKLANHSKSFLVIESDLNNIGSLIAKCHSFLSTDSGLGHIAIAKNIKTIAIFGPANKTRTAPFGEKGEVITLDLECSPCMGYPFTQTHSRIRCPYQFKCLNELTVDTVYRRIKSIITS